MTQRFCKDFRSGSANRSVGISPVHVLLASAYFADWPYWGEFIGGDPRAGTTCNLCADVPSQKNNFRLHVGRLLNQKMGYICAILDSPGSVPVAGQPCEVFMGHSHPLSWNTITPSSSRSGGQKFDALTVRALSAQYLTSYRHPENPGFGDHLMHIHDEDLLADGTLEALNTFIGCDDLCR